MKKIFILIFAIFLCLNTRADQLSCLTKANADKASDIIKSKEFLVLFCGCCDNNELEMVKVLSANVIKDCKYQVVLRYENFDGEIKSKSIDLAYVWMEDPSDSNKGITIASYLNLKHDPCVEWSDVMMFIERQYR